MTAELHIFTSHWLDGTRDLGFFSTTFKSTGSTTIITSLVMCRHYQRPQFTNHNRVWSKVFQTSLHTRLNKDWHTSITEKFKGTLLHIIQWVWKTAYLMRIICHFSLKYERFNFTKQSQTDLTAVLHSPCRQYSDNGFKIFYTLWLLVEKPTHMLEMVPDIWISICWQHSDNKNQFTLKV